MQATTAHRDGGGRVDGTEVGRRDDVARGLLPPDGGGRALIGSVIDMVGSGVDMVGGE
jgi:hypothetical protein